MTLIVIESQSMDSQVRCFLFWSTDSDDVDDDNDDGDDDDDDNYDDDDDDDDDAYMQEMLSLLIYWRRRLQWACYKISNVKLSHLREAKSSSHY